MVPPLNLELLWKWPAAKVATLASTNPTINLHAGQRLQPWPRNRAGVVAIAARDLVRCVPYRKIFSDREAHWGRAFLFSCLAWLLWPSALAVFRQATAKIKENEHIRGARLTTEAEIAARSDGTGILPIGRVLISETLSRRHILIGGQTGSGKSTVLMQHLDAIQRAKRRAIVNDFKGELVERFYRPGQDYILNLLDERGLGWTIFNEIGSKPDLTAITGSLIPPAKGEDRFWSAAAQDVLRGVMAYCYEHGRGTNAQLWAALTSPLKNITDMCRATRSGQAGFTYVQDSSSKQALGVIAVLMSYVAWLEFAGDGPFCLREWAANPADNTIFITNIEETSQLMRPYLSLFADLAGKRFLALPENPGPERNIYIILDEMGNMQRLPTVKRLLTAGRSKGVVMEIGVPDFASIESIYGKEDAHIIMNSCGSKFMMNVGDEDTARVFSGLAGEEEYWESATYYSISQNENRGGENHNRQIKLRKVVLPSELTRLPVGHGFFMLPGGDPARIVVPQTEANRRKVTNPAFLLRPGLSLEMLGEKNEGVAAFAQQVGPAPDVLQRQLVGNGIRRTRGELDAEQTLGVHDDQDPNTANDLSR